MLNPENVGGGDALDQLAEFYAQPASPESISALRGSLFELSKYAPRLELSREATVTDIEESGVEAEGSLQLSTSEVTGYRAGKSLRLAIPYLDRSGAVAHGQTKLEKDPETKTWRVWFGPENGITPSDLVKSASIPQVLPTSARALLGIITAASVDNKIFNATSLTEPEFDELWAATHRDLDEAAVPTTASYDYGISIKGTPAQISNRDVVPGVNGEFPSRSQIPFTHTSIHAKDDFHYFRNQKDGVVEEYFNDESLLDFASLPDLTEDERSRHPYVVVPITLEDELSLYGPRDMAISSEQPSGETTEPIEPIELDETENQWLEQPRYKIIIPFTDAGMQYTNVIHFESLETAQKFADDRYRRELAISRLTQDVTEQRAQHMIQAIRILLNHEYAHSPDNYSI